MTFLTRQEIQSALDVEDAELRNKMFIMKMKKYSMYSLGQFEAKDRKIVYELLINQLNVFNMYLELIMKGEH